MEVKPPPRAVFPFPSSLVSLMRCPCATLQTVHIRVKPSTPVPSHRCIMYTLFSTLCLLIFELIPHQRIWYCLILLKSEQDHTFWMGHSCFKHTLPDGQTSRLFSNPHFCKPCCTEHPVCTSPYTGVGIFRMNSEKWNCLVEGACA